MSDENENTPEETEAEARQRQQEEQMRNLVVRMTERSEDAAVDKFTQLLDGISARKPADPVEEVTEPVRVPARSAGRTLPASLTDSRYRFLPAWQRSWRNPDDDYQVSRFLRAVAAKDHVTLRTIAAEDHHARADLEEGGSTAGAPFAGTAGQLLPLPLANYLLEVLYKAGRMRNHARVFQRGEGASLRIPLQTIASVPTWTAEGVAASGTEPAFGAGMINLVLQKLTNLAVVSNEVLEDEVFGLASWLTNDVGMSMVEEEDTRLYSLGTGSGDDEPLGFEGDATSVGTAPVFFVPTLTQVANFALATLIDYEHLVKMYYALPERERMGAIWTGPSTVMQTLSTMLDGGTTGRPILAMQNDPGMIVGDADGGAMIRTLFGRPVVEMPGLEGTGEDANRLYFVNMSRAYFMLEAGGIRVAATNEGGTAFSTDTTHFRFIRRVDGQPSGNPIEAKPQYVYTGNITGAGTPIA